MQKYDKKYKKNIYDTLKKISETTGALIIGLTGGIATGKSTVSEYFEKLGAVIIDFDVLARKVVEPGRKAWKLITDYFGDDILNTDNTINRKKLSNIVFGDHLKREKLESFTHPYIWEEFLHQVRHAALKDSNCIILAVVPLLIEGNMQYIFSKNIAVYAPQEMQIERLMERDRISREKARDILSSQMPVDEKINYVDFIIKNDGPVNKTEEQAKILWKTFIKIVKENQHDQC
jgi:dephospho-CoA kinase